MLVGLTIGKCVLPVARRSLFHSDESTAGGGDACDGIALDRSRVLAWARGDETGELPIIVTVQVASSVVE